MNEGILLLDGSPRGTKSNTMPVTRAFLDGICETAPQPVTTLEIRQLQIEPCRGCFGCWKATPGQCVIHDDMQQVMEAMHQSQIILVSFPVYYYGLPGPVKTLLDRTLPVMLPYNGGPTLHRVRKDMKGKRFVFISTCGFQSTDGIYDAFRVQLRGIFGAEQPLLITVPQADLMHAEPVKKYTQRRLDAVHRLGTQFARGEIDEQLLAECGKPMIRKWIYQKMVSSFYGDGEET